MPCFGGRSHSALESLAAGEPTLASMPLVSGGGGYGSPSRGGGGGGGGGGGEGDDILGQKPGDGPARRLAHVAEKFSQFYNDLEHEKAARREVETGRRNALYDQVQALELNLEAEVRRRQEADRALQDKVAAELKAMEEGMAAHMREMQLGLRASIDALSRTFAELHGGLREEREQRRVDIEHLAQSVVAKVDECQAGIDDERVNRLEREAQTLKRVGEDIFRLQEKVDNERGHREATVSQLGADLTSLTHRTNTHDDKFQTIVLTEIAALKGALNAEKEERVAEDEQIVHAINDYTRALQDGLRIVNQS